MKNFYNKIRLSLTALWIAVLSFSSKVFAQIFEYGDLKYSQTDYWIARVQTKYWVESPIINPITDWSTPMIIAVKIVQIILIIIIPIIWIINLIKIRKIGDKIEKMKRIRTTIIILAILVLILIAAFLIPALLLKW